ncbi:hypothetical protein N0V90_013536 [Kalmusia sp. IMI 367209]|nr:hypothetical protein N0V90_013536 [Kalmusia sp. IMI 367209]
MEPMQQIEAEQIDGPAGNATRACFARFRSCIDALDGERRDYLESQFWNLRLWADSVGALAHGKASLDRRPPKDTFMVTIQLEIFEQLLERYKTAAIADGNEDEIEQAKEEVDGMMDQLVWLGSKLRRSGTISQLGNADMTFEDDRVGEDKWQYDQLRAHLICIVKSRPNELAMSNDYSKDFHSMELQGIQDRLVEANLRRWHRFRYAQRHSDIHSALRIVQDMPRHVAAEGNAFDSAREAMLTPAPRINTAAAKQGFEAKDQSETRITQRNALLCPCCCQGLPIEEVEDPNSWTKHIRIDIRPYTCIVENCPKPYQLYITRDEWREHVLRDHQPKWRCSCCTGTRPVFQSERSFMIHLDDEHESELVNISNKDFNRIVSMSTIRPFGITSCPLCNEQGPTDSPLLIEHVLEHIYNFSMYALPWRTTPQKSLKKPIRTFNDVAPVLDPNDKEDTKEMRMFSHTRILEWVKEPRSPEGSLTPEQRVRIRDLDWDDYQAIDNEDGVDSLVADHFDRPGVDYFEDGTSGRGASSRAGLSADIGQLSISSNNA